MTLIEVLVGSVIGSVLVAGLMAAFLTALRVSGRGTGGTEAGSYAQETLERFRNRIACDDVWFGPPCNFLAPVAAADALPGGALYGPGASRTYTITPEDCDGVGGAGDCFKVVTKVSWTQPQ
jgi:hypothetical protein